MKKLNKIKNFIFIKYFLKFKRILILKLRNNNKLLLCLIVYNILTISAICLTPFTFLFYNLEIYKIFNSLNLNFTKISALITYLNIFSVDFDIDELNFSGLISNEDKICENTEFSNTTTDNLGCENLVKDDNINKNNNKFNNLYKNKTF